MGCFLLCVHFDSHGLHNMVMLYIVFPLKVIYRKFKKLLVKYLKNMLLIKFLK